MIRLCRAELRKVWGSRFFLLSLVVLLCANLCLKRLCGRDLRGKKSIGRIKRIRL